MFKSCVSLGTIFSCGFILIKCTCEAGEYFNQTVTKFFRPGWPEYQLGGDRNNRIDQSASKETNKTITRKRSFSSYILSRSERASRFSVSCSIKLQQNTTSHGHTRSIKLNVLLFIDLCPSLFTDFVSKPTESLMWRKHSPADCQLGALILDVCPITTALNSIVRTRKMI